MAISYVDRSSYGSSGSSTPLQLTVPATAQEGDLLLAVLGDGNGLSFNAITLPAGWSHAPGSPISDSGPSPHRFVLCWKVASATDPSATYSWGQTTNTNSHGRILVYRSSAGPFGADPISLTDSDHNTGTSGLATCSVPGGTASENLYCVFFELGWSIGVGITEPGTWNNRFFQNTTGQVGFLVRDGGSAGVGSWQQSPAVGGTAALSFTLVVREAAPGTTDDAIAAGGTPLALVAAIEGYPSLITNWHDKQAVEVAWDSQGFDGSVIGGLSIQGEYSQEIRPLDPQMDFGTIALRILPDATDQLGKDVWSSQKNSGQIATLSASVDPSDETMTVVSTSAWTGNRAYIGTESFLFDSITGTTVTVTTGERGQSQPFQTAGGAGFARPHVITENSGAALYRPIITDWKRVWIGSHIGLWLHKADGDDINSKANARLLFAGTVADIVDNEDGSTTLVCVDIRQSVGERLLLSDQWSAVPAEGIDVAADSKVAFALETNSGAAPKLVIIDIPAASYTADELCDYIMQQVGTLADYAVDMAITQEGFIRVEATLTSSSSPAEDALEVTFLCTPALAGVFGILNPNQRNPSESPGYLSYHISGLSTAVDPVAVAIGDYPVAYADVKLAFGAELTVTAAAGAFVPQGDQMPQIVKTLFGTDDGNDWGFVAYRDYAFLVRKDSDTVLTVMWDERLVLPMLSLSDQRDTPAVKEPIVRRGEPPPRIKQIILLEENLGDWLPRLLASTGDAGYNNATYDEYDRQLGCGIPWSLLGDQFLESCREIAEIGDSIVTVMLDRPTQVRELLLPELALRNAHLIFRNGLVFRRASADVVNADHTLTDSNMIGGVDDYTEVRPTVNQTRELIVNSIKVEFNRTPEGKYLDSIEVQNSTSIAEHGVSQPITIKARNNAYRGRGDNNDGVYEVLEAIAGDTLAIYDEPLRIVSMPVDGVSISTMAPGDSVNLTNSFIRDPTTGERGASGLLGFVLRTSFEFDSMRGDIDVLLTGAEAARIAPLSPAAKIDETYTSGLFTAGYDSTNDIIRLKANEYSGASEADDVTHFADGDKIRVIEKSPATAASPQTWAVTADSVDTVNGEITLSAALTGFSTSKEYYVIADDYSTSVTAQKSDAYIADNADDQILDTVRSRQWKQPPPYSWDLIDLKAVAGATTDLFEIPPTDGSWWSEGEPINAAMLQVLSSQANHLVYKRGVLQTAWWYPTGGKASSNTSYEAICVPFPVMVSPGSNKEHTLTLGCYAKVASASTGTIRVSTWRGPPSGPDTFVDIDFLSQRIRSVELSTTSTAGENITATTLKLNLDRDGVTWITIQAKNSAGVATTVYGWHTWSVEPAV